MELEDGWASRRLARRAGVGHREQNLLRMPLRLRAAGLSNRFGDFFNGDVNAPVTVCGHGSHPL
jgi:hypothetical protein